MSMWFRTTWLNVAVEHLQAGVTLFKRRRRWVTVAASLLTWAVVVTPFAAADEAQPAAFEEASILVSSPGASSASDSTTAPSPFIEDGGTLEPIPQVAERTPDLADITPIADPSVPTVADGARSPSPKNRTVHAPLEDTAAQFGAALAEVVRSQQTTRPSGRSLAIPRPIGRTVVAAGRAAVPFEPAKFNGIQPGTSTKDELLTAWGEPAEAIGTSEGAVLTYDMEPFELVEVLISPEGVVAALKIALAEGLEPKQLARQLGLDALDPVTITDDEESSPDGLGLAYPERGVVFMYDVSAIGGPSSDDAVTPLASPLVSHVAIQSLDARAFALRAENRLHGPYEQNIRDLLTAISLDPDFSHARWLLAEIYIATGQADLADVETAETMAIEPENAAYQLRRGQALILLGRYDDAVHEIRAVVDREDAPSVVRAQAMHEMARLASLGDAEIAAKAISFDTQAIELADLLATSRNTKERRAAKRLLVEAHLSVAEEIARQSFGGKVDSLSAWIERASGLTEDYIENDEGSVELRLLMAQRVLAALASFKPTLDPAPWVAEAEEAATALRRQSDDVLWQQRIDWELGIAYLHALRTEHLRRETSTALAYGQLAIENLADGAMSRQAVHSAEHLVGQLYFHVGAVHAVHQQDHQQAVQWYDKAVPMLTGPLPDSELYSPRRDGELLVSMGVSYWQTGSRARALDLTQQGARLVEQAVADGILGREALAAPYGNLASMYQQTGDTASASKYATLARAAESPPPRTSRSPANQSGRTGAIQTAGRQQNLPVLRR